MDLLRRMRWPVLTRRDADRLLDRDPTADPVLGPHAGLAGLLAAAAGPPTPEERAGEASAATVFRLEFRPGPEAAGRAGRSEAAGRAGRSEAAGRAGRSEAAGRSARAVGLPGRRPTRLRRHRVAVVLSFAVVAVVGGTAFAAGTNRLPDPVQRQLHEALAGVGIPAPDDHDTGGAPPDRHPSPAPTGGPPDDATLIALCRAWQEAQGAPAGPQPKPDDRRVLADAAGGEDRVGAFCDALDATPTPDPSTSSTPGRSGGADPAVPSGTTPGRGNGNGHGGGGKGNGGNGKGNGPHG